MGCVSCKLILSADFDFRQTSGEPSNHIVSVTSTTYGALNLDPLNAKQTNHGEHAAEVIDARELMKDLADENPKLSPVKKTLFRDQLLSPKSRLPSSRIRHRNSPINASPFKSWVSSEHFSSRSPCFDPELITSFEKEYLEEGEKIKNISAVILYTTTLRGIRKTFEDCNAVRAAIESYGVRFEERDVSMDLGFREELRKMMKLTKEVSLPVLFVKGILVGGAEEVRRLDEEGKLAVMLKGVPEAEMTRCQQCGGARFIMCDSCGGSSKVFGKDGRKTARCGDCNENGLRRCPAC